MAQESAFILLSLTRRKRAKPLIRFEKSSRFFEIAAVFELGMEPGAGVTFLSMSTSDDTMTNAASAAGTRSCADRARRPCRSRHRRRHDRSNQCSGQVRRLGLGRPVPEFEPPAGQRPVGVTVRCQILQCGVDRTGRTLLSPIRLATSWRGGIDGCGVRPRGGLGLDLGPACRGRGSRSLGRAADRWST